MTPPNLEPRLVEAGALTEPLTEAARAALSKAEHITEDSRRVRPGSIFAAVGGTKSDGHDFARQAAEAGAIAIVGEREGLETLEGLPYLRAKHTRLAVGIAAHALHDDPTRDMVVVGITGTNGKSSTAALTDAILQQTEEKTALFGTLGYVIDGWVEGQEHTTPFGEDLAALFAKARDRKVKYVTMEVSSHALHQERVAGIQFDVAAITNLTQDHLDYHKTMEAYRDAKMMLFQREGLRAAVVNVDDDYGEAFRACAECPVITYGKKGDLRAKKIKPSLDGTTFNLKGKWDKLPVHLRLLGAHNVYNALCAAAIADALDIPPETIIRGLEALPSVPGRFEPVAEGLPFQVVVDYAHTDDGLRNVLQAARKLAKKRVITVFGCGGDRDRGKRPKMGKAAGELSDFCVLTSDNPRTEDPLRILLDAEMGLQQAGKEKGKDYEPMVDRREGIGSALARAKKGDIVVIAGKGHEDYQILGTEKIHFDDREVAREVLEELGY